MAKNNLSAWLIRWVDKIIIHFTTITHNRLVNISIGVLGAIGMGSGLLIPSCKFFFDKSCDESIWQVIIDWNTEEVWPSIITIVSILAITIIFCVNRLIDSKNMAKHSIKSNSQIKGNSNVIIQNSQNVKINGH
ncbi:hypothetical protein IMSAGC004_00585 [Bacteroidaceae bacterium]|nr:hypothetical protein IMSAGC004_00585 [Bacteroidaceae bacterium]